MKKILSVVLAVVLVFCMYIPSTAVSLLYSQYPIIYFRGNSEQIIDENGDVVYDFDVDTETVKEMAKRILPYFARGLVTNDFDEYYKVFGDEMAALYDRVLLDYDGNPKYGTGISEKEKNNNRTEMNSNYVQNGKYSIWSYAFANDWRLDPMKTVEDVKEYVDGVLKATGKDKVCLACKCLGGDLILAYLAKYGNENIHAVCFGSTVAFGGYLANDMFAGRANLDPQELTRFLSDKYIDKQISDDMRLVYDFLMATLKLANETGVTEGLTTAFMNGLYDRLYEGLVPALATSTYATWPGYWTMVTADRYEEAKTFVFGQPGSEKYTQYAGLIEKLDSYDVQVRQRIPELLKSAEADGVKICITSKYGFQMPPCTESGNEQGDVWALAKHSSCGATVSETGTVLSDSYIAERKALGYGKYISPDGQIDASTCLFPEYTWFIKGAVHNDWTYEEDNILIRVCDSDVQLTVDTMPDRPQFLVYDSGTDTVSPMTADNSDTEYYDVDKQPEKGILHFFKLLKEWFRLAYEYIKTLF